MQSVKEQLGQQSNDTAPKKDNNYPAPTLRPGYEAGKRIFDCITAGLGLVVLSPLFLIVSIAVWANDFESPIYSQIRLTKGGKPFRMYKFRSMCKDADKMQDALMAQNEMDGPAFKMANDPRITGIGRFIRKTSIDELPQLINVLKGDMSIIGPRPPLPREVEQYTPYQMHRLDVKTGLACYHECEGRSDCHDFDQWVEADLRYIRERSFRTDMKILCTLFKVVLTGQGAV